MINFRPSPSPPPLVTATAGENGSITTPLLKLWCSTGVDDSALQLQECDPLATRKFVETLRATDVQSVALFREPYRPSPIASGNGAVISVSFPDAVSSTSRSDVHQTLITKVSIDAVDAMLMPLADHHREEEESLSGERDGFAYSPCTLVGVTISIKRVCWWYEDSVSNASSSCCEACKWNNDEAIEQTHKLLRGWVPNMRVQIVVRSTATVFRSRAHEAWPWWPPLETSHNFMYYSSRVSRNAQASGSIPPSRQHSLPLSNPQRSHSGNPFAFSHNIQRMPATSSIGAYHSRQPYSYALANSVTSGYRQGTPEVHSAQASYRSNSGFFMVQGFTHSPSQASAQSTPSPVLNRLTLPHRKRGKRAGRQARGRRQGGKSKADEISTEDTRFNAHMYQYPPISGHLSSDPSSLSFHHSHTGAVLMTAPNHVNSVGTSDHQRSIITEKNVLQPYQYPSHQTRSQEQQPGPPPPHLLSSHTSSSQHPADIPAPSFIPLLERGTSFHPTYPLPPSEAFKQP